MVVNISLNVITVTFSQLLQSFTYAKASSVWILSFCPGKRDQNSVSDYGITALKGYIRNARKKCTWWGSTAFKLPWSKSYSSFCDCACWSTSLLGAAGVGKGVAWSYWHLCTGVKLWVLADWQVSLLAASSSLTRAGSAKGDCIQAFLGGCMGIVCLFCQQHLVPGYILG